MTSKRGPQSDKQIFHKGSNSQKKSLFNFFANKTKKRQPSYIKRNQKYQTKSLVGDFFKELFGLSNPSINNPKKIQIRHYLIIFIFLAITIGLLSFRFGYADCNFLFQTEYCKVRKKEIEKKLKVAERNLIYANPRHNIVDRNGQILATDLIYYYLDINPYKLNLALNQNSGCQVETFYKKIEKYIKPKSATKKRFENFNEFKKYLIRNNEIRHRRLGELDLVQKNELVDVLKSTKFKQKNGKFSDYLKCEFIGFESFYKRSYPQGENISSLIGYVGLVESDQKNSIFIPHGQTGIEYKFEQDLTRQTINQKLLRSINTGQVTGVNELNQESLQDYTVSLSIDSDFQNIVYNELKTTVDKFNAKLGAALLIDGSTGEVLALASYPSFDPEKSQSKAKIDLRKNHVFQSLITPGSTVKPFVLAIARETGALNNFSVDTDNEIIYSNAIRVTDSSKNGVLDADTVIVKSSNIGIIKMIRAVKQDDFAKYLMALDLAGDKVFDLPGEAKGLLTHPIDWSGAYYDYLATGYSAATTLSHLVRAYSVFFNGGYRVDLSLVKREKNESIPKIKVFQELTVEKVMSVLNRVVSTEGTAKDAKIDGLDVYGKTGTSQLLEKKYIPDEQGNRVLDNDGNERYTIRYSKRSHRALFVGMVQSEKRKYIMGVYVDKPKGPSYYGGSVAAPVFSNSMTQILKID